MKLIILVISLAILSCKNSLNNLDMKYKGNGKKLALIIFQTVGDYIFNIKDVTEYDKDKYEFNNEKNGKKIISVRSTENEILFIARRIFEGKNKKLFDLIIGSSNIHGHKYCIGTLEGNKFKIEGKEEQIEIIKSSDRCYDYSTHMIYDDFVYILPSDDPINILKNKLEGFNIIESFNEKEAEIEEKIKKFQNDEADIKLFYCSAHGNIDENNVEYFESLDRKRISVPYEDSIKCEKLFMFIDKCSKKSNKMKSNETSSLSDTRLENDYVIRELKIPSRYKNEFLYLRAAHKDQATYGEHFINALNKYIEKFLSFAYLEDNMSNEDIEKKIQEMNDDIVKFKEDYYIGLEKGEKFGKKPPKLVIGKGYEAYFKNKQKEKLEKSIELASLALTILMKIKADLKSEKLSKSEELLKSLKEYKDHKEKLKLEKSIELASLALTLLIKLKADLKSEELSEAQKLLKQYKEHEEKLKLEKSIKLASLALIILMISKMELE